MQVVVPVYTCNQRSDMDRASIACGARLTLPGFVQQQQCLRSMHAKVRHTRQMCLRHNIQYPKSLFEEVH